MFNSTVLEVAIGLVFCYASVALIASSVFEALASWLNLRSKTLLKGIKSLLNADGGSGAELLLKIYNHALAHPTGDGMAASADALKRGSPSYMEPKHFAVALIDAIQSVPNGFAKLAADIDALPNPQLRQLLRGMYDRAGGDAEHLQAQIAAWFDAAMNGVSGSYKRQSQLWCFVIAFFFAALINVDSIRLFSTLWQHPALVAQIAMPAATPTSIAALDGLNKLPIGWQTELPYFGFGSFTLIGWLITATAALFGAPFWFDLLQQLIRVRGTGTKPKPAPSIAPSAAQPLPSSGALETERNAIVDLHAARNEDDPSYRPIQPGERWQ